MREKRRVSDGDCKVSGIYTDRLSVGKRSVCVSASQISEACGCDGKERGRQSRGGQRVLVLVMELLKGFVPVHLAMGRLPAAEPLFGLVMAAPVLGHAFPLGNRRRGGKAIAVSFGVLLGIWPVTEPLFLLVALYLTFSLLVVVTPHFFRSVITFLLLFAGTAVLVELPGIVIGCGCVSGIVICKHLARYQGERMQVHLLQGSH